LVFVVVVKEKDLHFWNKQTNNCIFNC